MTQWAAFVGLTGAVLTAFLVLARLSQQLVQGDGADLSFESNEETATGADRRSPPDSSASESTPAAGTEPVPAETDAAPSAEGGAGSPGDEVSGPPSDEMSGSTGGESAPHSDGESTPHSGDGSMPHSDSESAPFGDEPAPLGDETAASSVDASSVPDRQSVAEPDDTAALADEARRGEAGTRSATSGGGSGAEARHEDAVTPFGIERERSTGPPEMSPGALLANVALTQGLFGFVLVAGAWYFQVPAGALGVGSGRLSSVPAAVAAGAAFGFALWIGNELASGVADAAGAEYDEELREMLAPESATGWAVLLGVTLPIIAGVEEFIFRAAAIGAPSAGFDTSPWALAIVSSVAFALGHGAQGRAGVVVTGALGLVLAAGFVLTESLVVVVVAHYLVNALEFGVHEGLGVPDPIFGSNG